MKLKTTLPSVMAGSAILLLIAAFNSPKDTTDFQAMVKPIIEMSKQHTLEVLDAMPEEKYTYKPTDISKTFGGQMYHIGYTLQYFTTVMVKGQDMTYEEADASTMSRDELHTLVEKSFDEFAEAVGSMTQEELMTEIPFGQEKKITRQQAILFALDHTTNHRAKANLYIRMNEMQPPSYKYM